MGSYAFGDNSLYDPVTGLPRTAKKKTNAPAPFTTGAFGAPTAIGLAPSTSGAPGPPGSINIPGFTPDYKALIQAALGPMTAQFGAENVADASTRDQQLIRALGQFGQQFDLEGANQAFGPQFVTDSGLGGILPQANALAKQTTDAGMSFTARSADAHKKAVAQIRNNLAARGLLRSGATGVALQDAQDTFDTGQYDARQQVQDFLGAINAGYVKAKRERDAQLAGAAREEAPRQAELNPATGSADAQYDPTMNLWKGPDGRFYNQDGTPATPAAPAAAAPPPTAPVAQANPADPTSAALAALLRKGRGGSGARNRVM